MILEFTPLIGAVSLCWLLCVSRELLVPVLVSLLIFSSPSISVSLLMLLLLQIFSFVQATAGMRRENNGVAQKRFALVFLGGVIALFGDACGPGWQGRALGMSGLLLMIPNGITTFFFSRFYERLRLKSYLGSCVIPAFAALSILFKWRGVIQDDLGEGWRLTLLTVGAITLFLSGAMGFSRLRIKAVIVFWTQTWIGFSILAMASSSDFLVAQALAAVAIFTLSSAMLINYSIQLGQRHYVFARMASLGLPGMVGFSAIYFIAKILFELGFEWVFAGFAGFLIQAAALILCKPHTPRVSGSRVRISFGIVIAVQVAAGCGLVWFAKGGAP